MPTINRPIDVNNENEHYQALVKGQTKNDRNHDTSEIMLLFQQGLL